MTASHRISVFVWQPCLYLESLTVSHGFSYSVCVVVLSSRGLCCNSQPHTAHVNGLQAPCLHFRRSCVTMEQTKHVHVIAGSCVPWCEAVITRRRALARAFRSCLCHAKDTSPSSWLGVERHSQTQNKQAYELSRRCCQLQSTTACCEYDESWDYDCCNCFNDSQFRHHHCTNCSPTSVCHVCISHQHRDELFYLMHPKSVGTCSETTPWP